MPTGNKAAGWVFAVITAAALAAPPANAAPAREPPGVTVSPNVAPPPIKTERKGRPAGEGFRDCPDCPELVVVPAGSFRMGDLSGKGDRNEKPVRRVTIPDAFAVGKYEVTFSEWETCLSAAGCSHRPDDRGWGRGRLPATDVSWDDAKAYVGWLSRKTGKTYRLLSEAEWEYMARAGSETNYPWGKAVGHNRANCAGCGSVWDRKRPAPVGQFKPNRFGVYDTVGNVWEWVEDCWQKNYSGAPTNGTARITKGGDCSGRVLRGGSWYLSTWYARSPVRDWNRANVRSGNFGFRVARTLTR